MLDWTQWFQGFTHIFTGRTIGALLITAGAAAWFRVPVFGHYLGLAGVTTGAAPIWGAVQYDAAAGNCKEAIVRAQLTSSQARVVELERKIDAGKTIMDAAREREEATRTEADKVAAAAERMCHLASGLRRNFEAPVILSTLALPPEHVVASIDAAIAGTTARFVAKLNDAIFAGSAQGDWSVWDVGELANQVGTSRWFDPIRLHDSKTPFDLALGPLVADNIPRVLSSLTGTARRALVLVLDNTLWGGVIGDDGVEGIHTFSALNQRVK